MIRWSRVLLFVFIAYVAWKVLDEAPVTDEHFYDLKWEESPHGKVHTMSEYRGKVLLLFNSASSCGYTPQLGGLQNLWEKYRAKGLQVIGFPSNQFNQEFGSDSDIKNFCTSKYNVDFPMAIKSKVNGKGANQVFAHVQTQKPSNVIASHIVWNFTKFLVDKSGRVRFRFGPSDTPESIEPIIQELLAEDEEALKKKKVESMVPRTWIRQVRARLSTILPL